MILMDEFLHPPYRIPQDARFIVDYVGEGLTDIGGQLIQGPYAVLLKLSEKSTKLLHSCRTVYYAVRQAKADQRNWDLPSTPVSLSEPCRCILDIEVDFFKYLNARGVTTHDM
jgi:hypothetical protein